MYKSLIIYGLTILFFSNGAHSSRFCSMNEFKQTLAQLQTHMVGSSIVSLTSSLSSFSYSSSNVDEDSQFYMGSASKHMTAYMLLTTLHEAYPEESIERLLTEKLSILFPQSKLLSQINREWLNEITLLDLLTHRSGLTDYLDSYGDGLTQPEALNEPIDAVILLQSISFDHEKKHAYSNSNYLLLGKIIEELNRDSFDHIFEKMIKEPANMTSSYAPIEGNYFTLKQGNSYSRLVPNLNDKVFLDMANAVGPGNVISTITDLKRWGAFLFKKAPGPIIDLMLKNYGLDPDGDIINLGFGTIDTCLGQLIGHQGGIDSYSSFFGYAPTQDTLILILSNSNDDSNKLMQAMTEWLSQPKEKILDKEQRMVHFFAKNYVDKHSEAEDHEYGLGARVFSK